LQYETYTCCLLIAAIEGYLTYQRSQALVCKTSCSGTYPLPTSTLKPNFLIVKKYSGIICFSTKRKDFAGIELNQHTSQNLTFYTSDSKGEYIGYIRSIDSGGQSQLYGSCRIWLNIQ